MELIKYFTAKNLSNIVFFFAIALVIVQFFKDQVQKQEDDKRDKAIQDSTASLAAKQEAVINLQDSLIHKHEELNTKLELANRQLEDLSDFVTGGNNKPIFNYLSSSQVLWDDDGKQLGNYYKVSLFLANIGKTPITNVSVKFHDTYQGSITPEGYLNRTPSPIFFQKRSLNSITRETIEPFYDLRIPSWIIGSVDFIFVIIYNSDYYHARVNFTVNPSDHTVELTMMELRDRYKKTIEDPSKFFGYKIKSLNDYKFGEMLKK